MSGRDPICGESDALVRLDHGTLVFRCPSCGAQHHCAVKEGAGRPAWGWNGSLDRPTLTPWVLATYDGPDAAQEGYRAPPAVCHGFVADGRIQFLGDCTHALAGQTVDIPEWGA